MGIGTVASATYSAAIPTSQNIGLPRSDYQTPSPITGFSGSSAVAVGINNTSSSSGDSDSDEDLDEGGGPSSTTHKRKRGGSGGAGVGVSTSRRRMMYFFQGLMKQVMEKQEAMQQRFLETIEKTEQDRMIREEAWKCQEMARLTREHEMMAQDRAISASRHATVIAILRMIAGQTVQLPSSIIIPATPLLLPQSIPPPAAPAPPPQTKQHQHHQIVPHQPQQQQPPQSSEVIITDQHQLTSTEHPIIAVPGQQHLPAQEMGSGGFDTASSRWQKTEVLALIKLRSRLDSRYREAGPREGPLWGEISAEMCRMGYSRSAVKCREKWQNINQDFKRVKESNKKRSEDAKTCSYFHQLDALHRKKVHGGSNQTNQESPMDHNQSSNTSSFWVDPNQTSTTLQAIMAPPPLPPQTNTNDSAETSIRNNNNGGGGSNIEGAASVAKKPENIVKELMEQRQRNHHQQPQPITMGYYGKMMEEDDDNIEDDEEMDDLDDDGDITEKVDDEDRNTRKMNYNIESQNRLNT